MPPSSQLVLVLRPAVRRPLVPAKTRQLCIPLMPRRGITAAEKPLPEAGNPGKGPNQDQLPHVSEEAGAISEIMGETKPEVEEQGTPVQEVLKREGAEAKEKAPKVMQEGMGKPAQGSRSYSTSARRQMELQLDARSIDDAAINYQTSKEMTRDRQSTQVDDPGHIHGLPKLPLPRNIHLKRREDPLVDQFTKLILQSGRLSRAQRTVAMILERLRTAPSPNSDPSRPLMPGAPPVSHLPLNPVLYMTLAVDSAAPLFRIRSQKGVAGGGAALQIPVPLTSQQRRRTCIKWILDAASKKRSNGSGRGMFANKVADELIAIVQGRSPIWEKRQALHKLGVAARANLTAMQTRKRSSKSFRGKF